MFVGWDGRLYSNFNRKFVHMRQLEPHNHYQNEDYPFVAPFLSTEYFTHCPVVRPVFNFTPHAYRNIVLIDRCKAIMNRLDDLVKNNNLNLHASLILQAGSQTTMRLSSKIDLRSDWSTTVEFPFCLHIIEEGYCPRILDFEDLEKHEHWLFIFEEVLRPLDRVEQKYIPIIAPHQASKICKDALMKAKYEKNIVSKNRFRSASSSEGYSSC